MNTITSCFKWSCAGIAGFVGVCAPFVPLYLAWSWVISEVPKSEYAGLIKIGLAFLMWMVGGGICLWLGILLGMFLFAIAVAALDA